MKRLFTIICFICFIFLNAAAQKSITADFKPVCDSLDAILKQNRDVKGELKL